VTDAVPTALKVLSNGASRSGAAARRRVGDIALRSEFADPIRRERGRRWYPPPTILTYGSDIKPLRGRRRGQRPDCTPIVEMPWLMFSRGVADRPAGAYRHARQAAVYFGGQKPDYRLRVSNALNPASGALGGDAVQGAQPDPAPATAGGSLHSARANEILQAALQGAIRLCALYGVATPMRRMRIQSVG